MYIRNSHRPQSATDVFEIISRHMFATIVMPSPDALVASHLPFVYDAGRGENGTLYAHMAAANPHSSLIGGDQEALVMFAGPHAYISPSWYADRATAPTWDYIAVHCYGVTQRHSKAEAYENIRRLIDVVEEGNAAKWSMSELTEEEVARLLSNVVSFEIRVARLEAKFKLNQGEKPERTRAAIAELERQGSSVLAEYMRRYNDAGPRPDR